MNPYRVPLRKHAYSNILKILPPKNENFQIKNSYILHISAQNIDCGYSLESPHRGGSNEYPQSMFLSRNKKNNVYPCKPQFYHIKVGFKGVKLYRYVLLMTYFSRDSMLFILQWTLKIYFHFLITNLMMEQGKGLNGNLKPTHVKTIHRTMVGPTTILVANLL